MNTKPLLIPLFTMSSLLVLTSCFDQATDNNTTTGTDTTGTTTQSKQLLRVANAEQPTQAECPNGGQVIYTGFDTNNNGTLDATEEDKRYPVCNGEDGKSAYQIWLDAGNTGTENDFLASLVGSSSTGSSGSSSNSAADLAQAKGFIQSVRNWGKAIEGLGGPAQAFADQLKAADLANDTNLQAVADAFAVALGTLAEALNQYQQNGTSINGTNLADYLTAAQNSGSVKSGITPTITGTIANDETNNASFSLQSVTVDNIPVKMSVTLPAHSFDATTRDAVLTASNQFKVEITEMNAENSDAFIRFASTTGGSLLLNIQFSETIDPSNTGSFTPAAGFNASLTLDTANGFEFGRKTGDKTQFSGGIKAVVKIISNDKDANGTIEGDKGELWANPDEIQFKGRFSSAFGSNTTDAQSFDATVRFKAYNADTYFAETVTNPAEINEVVDIFGNVDQYPREGQPIPTPFNYLKYNAFIEFNAQLNDASGGVLPKATYKMALDNSNDVRNPTLSTTIRYDQNNDGSDEMLKITQKGFCIVQLDGSGPLPNTNNDVFKCFSPLNDNNDAGNSIRKITFTDLNGAITTVAGSVKVYSLNRADIVPGIFVNGIKYGEIKPKSFNGVNYLKVSYSDGTSETF